MEIRLLKSPEDLLKAYNLVYKIYIKEGFISSNNLELRVRENYELTDHIYTYGCFDSDNMIGVLSLIDGETIKLPTEKFYDLSKYRSSGKVCEITNLAILTEYRKNLKLYHLLVYNVVGKGLELNCTWFSILVSPKHVKFFERFYGFKALGDLIDNNGDVICGMIGHKDNYRMI